MKDPKIQNEGEFDIETFRTELTELRKKIEQIEVKSSCSKGLLDEEEE